MWKESVSTGCFPLIPHPARCARLQFSGYVLSRWMRAHSGAVVPNLSVVLVHYSWCCLMTLSSTVLGITASCGSGKLEPNAITAYSGYRGLLSLHIACVKAASLFLAPSIQQEQCWLQYLQCSSKMGQTSYKDWQNLSSIRWKNDTAKYVLCTSLQLRNEDAFVIASGMCLYSPMRTRK